MTWIRTSIRNKLIVFMLVATVLPFATSIAITYFYTKQSVTEQTVVENRKLIQQGTRNVIQYLNVINKTSLTVYNDTFYQDTIYKIIDRDYQDSASAQQIYKFLLFASGAAEEIHQVNLYLSQSNRAFLMRRGFQTESRNVGTTLQPPGHSYAAFVEPPHIDHGYGIQLPAYYSPQAVFSIHRPIYRIPTDQLLGFLSIDLSLDTLRDVCEALYVKGQEELYVIDRSGTVIYSANESEIGRKGQQPWIERALQAGDDQDSYEWKDGSFKGVHITGAMKTEYMDWLMVKRVPYDMLYANAKTITSLNTEVLLLFLIVTAIATVVLSVRLTAPIRQLMSYMNVIQTGNFNVDINVRSSDEIGVVARRLQTLMQTINQLIMREYRLELANKSYQLKALQAQINPHFLNNALQSIGTLALQLGARKVYTLVTALGKMMRYGMNTEETIVPLRKELEYVRAYMELQQQRFGDKFTYELDVEPEAEEVALPKMVVQPIVENYFKHGMYGAARGLVIISAKLLRSQNMLSIAVWNNGSSMPEERLRELQAGMYRPNPVAVEGESTRIGLANVAARLQLYFGENAQVLAENSEPEGFRVTLLIPLEFKNEWKGVEDL